MSSVGVSRVRVSGAEREGSNTIQVQVVRTKWYLTLECRAYFFFLLLGFNVVSPLHFDYSNNFSRFLFLLIADV